MDSAFRGSVCRCHACGALIKVPRKRRTGAQAGGQDARPDSPLDVTEGANGNNGQEPKAPHSDRRQKPKSRRLIWFGIAIIFIGLAVLAYEAYRMLNP